MAKLYICFELTLVLYLIHLIVTSSTADRKMFIVVNPSCEIPECSVENSTANLVYVRADGEQDTIHYLWSSINSYSMLIAKTPLESQLKIDWSKFFSDDIDNSITFSPNATYSGAVVFTDLWEYDDPDDVIDVTKIPYGDLIRHPFSAFHWKPVVTENATSAETKAQFVISDSEFGDEALKLSLIAYGGTGHAKMLPRLPHTPYSFQLEMTVDHFNTSFSQTRFGLEIAACSDEPADGNFILEKFHSIDDEYTPGVFITYQMTSPKSQAKDWGSYLQWKPVCYTSSARTTEDSVDVKQDMGNLTLSDRPAEMNKSLVYAFYGKNPSCLTSFLNVSYGTQGDRYYQNSKYLTWTTTVGIGVPPTETFSTLVIIVIIVGFGLPALFIIIGGMFIMIRKFRSRDDDLDLSSNRLFDDSSP